MTQKYQTWLMLSFAVLFLGVVSTMSFSQPSQKQNKSLEKYATELIQLCASEKYRPGCYDREIPKLMDVISMEDAFKVTKLIIDKDPSYFHCHVVGHKLAGREVKKNPAAWKDVIARCPANICNNGCLHGPFLERYNKEVLSPQEIEGLIGDLQNVCEPRGAWHPNEVERSMCYHALGHLHMYITGAEIDRALSLCQRVGVKSDGRNYVQTCTEGVFMQIYQPLEPEDFALVKGLTPTKDKVGDFCARFSGESYDACHREAWPLFFDQIQKPPGLEQFCGYTREESGRWKCFAAVMNIITVRKVTDNENKLNLLEEFCQGLKNPGLFEECYAQAARRLMQIDPAYLPKALEICELSRTHGLERRCYEYLTFFAGELFSSSPKDYQNYCAALPEEWQNYCSRAI